MRDLVSFLGPTFYKVLTGTKLEKQCFPLFTWFQAMVVFFHENIDWNLPLGQISSTLELFVFWLYKMGPGGIWFPKRDQIEVFVLKKNRVAKWDHTLCERFGDNSKKENLRTQRVRVLQQLVTKMGPLPGLVSKRSLWIQELIWP